MPMFRRNRRDGPGAAGGRTSGSPIAVSPPSPTAGEYVVECRQIKKAFGGVHALRGVDVAFRPGEVTALLGDNGAGKSTLVKILGGMYPPDDGEIVVAGERSDHLTPGSAAEQGIEVVYQDLALCDNLNAAANIVLGREPVRRGPPGFRMLDRRRASAIGRERVAALGATVRDWSVPVRQLSGGQRQALAIARATISGHRLIVLDEPTAALGVHQTEATLRLVRNVAENGVAVVLIMHSIDQVMSVADRVVVLRLGAVCLDVPRAQTTKDEVVMRMMGVEREEARV